MRRVLYVVMSLEGGGAESQVVEHLIRLPRDRFRPELALCRREGVHLPRVPADVPVHELGPGRGLPRVPQRRRTLRRIVQERGIDVVASFLWYPDLLNLLVRGARRVCFVRNDHRRLGAGTRLNERVGVALVHRLYRRADRVVFQTPATAEYVRRIARLPEERTAVLPNGVDTRRLEELAGGGAPPPWPAQGLRLLAAGRLHRQKGFDLLLEALARVRRGGVDASLLVLGEGAERSHLLAQARRLGLAEAVSLPGFLENPYPAFRRADAFVLASRWEGFPNVILEALALGTPVVATDCPSGPALLLEGGAGVLVPPDDAAALARAILGLAPERRAELARRGRERAREFEWDVVLPRIVALYDSL